jgi:hypothetical protein
LCRADPAVKAFGIQVETQMSTVDARILNPPLLAYQRPEAITPGTRVSGGRGGGLRTVLIGCAAAAMLLDHHLFTYMCRQ